MKNFKNVLVSLLPQHVYVDVSDVLMSTCEQNLWKCIVLCLHDGPQLQCTTSISCKNAVAGIIHSMPTQSCLYLRPAR